MHLSPFLFLLVYISASHGQHVELPVGLNDIVDKLFVVINETTDIGLKPYTTDIFKPFSGPFFYPLWELPQPYSMFAIIGFPNFTGIESPLLNPTLNVNETIALYNKTSSNFTFHTVLENVTLFDVMLKLFQKFETVEHSHIKSRFDCGMSSLTDLTEKFKYQEIVRPRYYLPVAIDIYRALLKSTEECGRKGAEMGDCVTTLQDYSQLLWMYNWIVCTVIGHRESDDVDGICPKLCRPHPADVITGSYEIPDNTHFAYKSLASEYALDVCEQMIYAVPGTCSLVNANNSVGIDDFKCECLSQAYEWSIQSGMRGCLLAQRILDAANTSNSSTWRVECLESENICHADGTDMCYYRVQRNDSTKPLIAWEPVFMSYQPHCHCRSGYSGRLCNEKFNACTHQIEGAIADSRNYLNTHIPDGPYIPLFYVNDSAKASGNWLCGVTARRGKCTVNQHVEGGFECICAKGYTRDANYSRFDNCMSEAVSENSTEIDGRQVVVCGSRFCLNNGRCVVKPANPLSISNASGDALALNELDVTQVCECPIGFFGTSCDVEENVWSTWDNWSPCVPNCGQLRYQFRMRSCIGDAGCIGSALESARCPNTECPLLEQIETTSSQQPGHTGEHGKYHSVSRNQMLIWMLGLMVPLEILIILIGVVVLEKIILKRRYQG